MFGADVLTFREFMTREPLPLATLQQAVLEFLRGRDDVVVFDAQAVNAYVNEPRMTQDLDLMSPQAETVRSRRNCLRGQVLQSHIIVIQDAPPLSTRFSDSRSANEGDANERSSVHTFDRRSVVSQDLLLELLAAEINGVHGAHVGDIACAACQTCPSCLTPLAHTRCEPLFPEP